MLEDVFSDERITRLDLGQGDAEYKQAFEPARTDEADVVILAKRPRAVALGMLSSAVLIVNGWGRRVIRDTTKGRQFEPAWRRRLTDGSSTSRSLAPIAGERDPQVLAGLAGAG